MLPTELPTVYPPTPLVPSKAPDAPTTLKTNIWIYVLLGASFLLCFASLVGTISIWQSQQGITRFLQNMRTRVDDITNVSNTNLAAQRKEINGLTEQLGQQNRNTQGVIDTAKQELTTLRQGTFSSAHETIALKTTLQQLTERLNATEAALTAFSTSNRNLQRLLKEHDDLIRSWSNGPPNSQLSSNSQLGSSIPSAIIVDGGTVARPARTAAPKAAPSSEEVFSVPLPPDPASLFSGSKPQ